jgi:hypothetical protein
MRFLGRFPKQEDAEFFFFFIFDFICWPSFKIYIRSSHAYACFQRIVANREYSVKASVRVALSIYPKNHILYIIILSYPKTVTISWLKH